MRNSLELQKEEEDFVILLYTLFTDDRVKWVLCHVIELHKFVYVLNGKEEIGIILYLVWATWWNKTEVVKSIRFKELTEAHAKLNERFVLDFWASIYKLCFRLRNPDSKLKLWVEEMQSAVTCGLSIISIEDEFREAGKDIALATEENHFQVLKMLDKVHSSMHKM